MWKARRIWLSVALPGAISRHHTSAQVRNFSRHQDVGQTRPVGQQRPARQARARCGKRHFETLAHSKCETYSRRPGGLVMARRGSPWGAGSCRLSLLATTDQARRRSEPARAP